eukprot:CAMPEP_0118927056 /NCGR_PEP_ID=MMETSP1169-20130426/4625_1 /TAXON_ID=36882 /ORGANISM="Pyramimonas obovata, Strain CCMP722" /LENGTH=181 /DNA_ID=CAMNT_0006868747 /DNA_START=317 /DNA_END=862 /DNA_ORIENTATION=-
MSSVPTLKTLIEQSLLQKSIRTVDVLRTYQYAEMVHAERLRQKCLKFIVDSFPALREMAGEENLRVALGDELFETIDKNQQETDLECQKFASRKGQVLEPKACEAAISGTGTGPVDSRAPVCYPYAALKAGVAWPAGVDPNSREAYLSEEEFLQVMGVTQNAFNELPVWKKNMLKKEASLF